MAGGCPRNTKQRQFILEYLKGVRNHPTADQVYHGVRKKMPRISLGTVYRNLELLSASGEIKKLEFGTQRRFDGFTDDHLHVRCIECQEVADVELGDVLSVDEAADKTGYKILNYQVEFIGYCPKCKEKKEG